MVIQSALLAALAAALTSGSAPAQQTIIEVPNETLLGPTPEVELTVARLDGEHWDILRTTSRGTQVWLEDGDFLPLELVGHAVKDRLRVDLPAERGGDSVTPHVRLPQGGSLYRIARDGRTALVLLREGAAPRILVEVPHAGDGTPGLDAHVHVSADGSRALALAPAPGAASLWSIALDAPFTALELGAGVDLGAVAPESLRSGDLVAWYVAGGLLHRIAADGSSPAEALAHATDAPIWPELALSRAGSLVVALALDASGKGRVFAATAGGPVFEVSESEQHYSPPGFDHPLGPFVAIAPDDALVAYRELDGSHHELWVRPLSVDDHVHVTTNSVFPSYIDSIGVFAFGQPRILCFFAGDTKLGGFEQDQALAAAEMYAVDLTDPQVPVFINVTKTNGELSPPFKQLSGLAFTAATVGPHGERIFLAGVDAYGQETLSCFQTEADHEPGVNLEVLAEALTEPALLAANTHGAVVVRHHAESWPTFSQPESKVDCAGDPALAPLVRILATNKADPFDTGAHVWFDGLVELGYAFTADAAAGGQSELASVTWVHVLALDDTVLQTVEFHSSCSEPLGVGDRFGASSIVHAVGKDDTGVAGPCATGDRPARLAMRLVGGGCDDSQHSQGSGVDSCSGDFVEAQAVHVLALSEPTIDQSGVHVWFDGFVEPGETFWVDCALAGKAHLDPRTWILVTAPDGSAEQTLELVTDCSAALVAGDQFGALELLDVVLEHPIAPDDACATGRPTSLTMTYTGEPCGPVALGHDFATLLSPSIDAAVAYQWALPADATVSAVVTATATPHVAIVTTGVSGAHTAWVHNLESGTLDVLPLPRRLHGAPRFVGDGRLAVAAALAPGLHGVLLLPGGGVVATANAPVLVLAD